MVAEAVAPKITDTRLMVALVGAFLAGVIFAGLFLVIFHFGPTVVVPGRYHVTSDGSPRVKLDNWTGETWILWNETENLNGDDGATTFRWLPVNNKEQGK